MPHRSILSALACTALFACGSCDGVATNDAGAGGGLGGAAGGGGGGAVGGGSGGTGGGVAGGSGGGSAGGSGGGTQLPASCSGSNWFIAPSGVDANTGQTEASPFKTFGKAFQSMAAGDTLVLLDGTYSEAAGTGSITWQSALGGQIPSGTSLGAMTCVVAKNPGAARVVGALFLGRSSRKDRFILLDGLTFEGSPASFYNTDSILVRNTGFHSEADEGGGILNVGSNDGDWGNTNLLFEDIWVWGQARIGILIYRSEYVVVRRAVVRHGGCASHADPCGNNSGNSVVGTTIYNSNHVSFQNVLVLDSKLGAGGYAGAADFQTAWHDNFFWPFGANSWLGVVSLNSELGGMYPEVDDLPGRAVFTPLFTFKDAVIVGSASAVSAQSGGSAAAHDLVIDGLTVVMPAAGSSGDAVRVGPQFSSTVTATNLLRDVVSIGPARFGVNSAIPPSYVDVFGAFTQGSYNQTTCGTGCYTTDPRADGATPSLRYPVRIEAGSFLSGKGFAGADLGATVVQRYGVDGTFFGAAGYDTLTSQPLWPWPNQARIRAELCPTGSSGGLCSAASVSSYVWQALGNACPTGLCQ